MQLVIHVSANNDHDHCETQTCNSTGCQCAGCWACHLRPTVIVDEPEDTARDILHTWARILILSHSLYNDHWAQSTITTTTTFLQAKLSIAAASPEEKSATTTVYYLLLHKFHRKQLEWKPNNYQTWHYWPRPSHHQHWITTRRHNLDNRDLRNVKWFEFML